MRADWMKVIIAVARLPLRSDPANNQVERPSAQGRIRFPTWLLSMGIRVYPPSWNTYIALNIAILCWRLVWRSMLQAFLT